MDTQPEILKLGDLRLKAGAAVLALTDEFAFGAIGAGWLYSSEEDWWWYFLVSPLIETKGPSWVYERLIKIFNKSHLPDGITALDIHVIGPNDPRHVYASRDQKRLHETHDGSHRPFGMGGVELG